MHYVLFVIIVRAVGRAIAGMPMWSATFDLGGDSGKRVLYVCVCIYIYIYIYIYPPRKGGESHDVFCKGKDATTTMMPPNPVGEVSPKAHGGIKMSVGVLVLSTRWLLESHVRERVARNMLESGMSHSCASLAETIALTVCSARSCSISSC